MNNHVHNYLVIAILIACMGLITTSADAVPKPDPFEAADSDGVRVLRNDDVLFIQINAEVKSPITIPRLAAPLRSMHWSGKEKGEVITEGLTLKPGVETWDIHWKDRPDDQILLDGKAVLVLEFDDKPLLLEELKPIEATGDGSFYIPAHLAVTRGDKIRYEPQPNKNTVGFWVNEADFAVWTIHLDKPGRFKVAVLQGCGRGQGGSKASIFFDRWLDNGRTPPQSEMIIDFTVLETGHFQNFQWVHIGEVALTQPGDTRIEVSPSKIKKAALMDIRAIHLIRLPDQKK